jgi:mannose/fructose/N-acetylgalactosamine-specific phosphotransferase system component IID
MAEKKTESQEVAAEVVAATPEEPKAAKKPFDWASLNTLSVVSLASAISGIGALIAVITGHIALKQIKQTSQAGRTLALTGTVLGWIIFGILVVIKKVLIISGAFGLQPMGPEFFEFERGFGGMHFGDR